MLFEKGGPKHPAAPPPLSFVPCFPGPVMKSSRATRLLAVLAATGVAHAQTLLTYDGGGATVLETTGPPAACAYPTGPILGAFPTPSPPAPCPGAGATPFGPFGSLTHDSILDIVYVTDGVVIASYKAGGGFIDSFVPPPLPGLVNGITVDAAAGILFYTDGTFIQGILPPPAPGCLGPVPIVFPAFPSPMGPGLFVAPLSDIAFEPATASLYAVDGAGMVGSIAIGGGPGPFPFYPIGVSGCIPPGSFLSGIAVDSAMPGSGIHYVTDGVTIGRFGPGGFPVAPTFYSPMVCWPNPGPPTNGLAFADHALLYGAPGGPVATTAGSIGTTYAGNPAFALTVTGPPVSGLGLLFWGAGGPACPAIPLGGGALLHVLPALTLLATVPIPPSGSAILPAAIPVLPAGLGIDLTWITGDAATGLIGTSEGLHMTITVP